MLVVLGNKNIFGKENQNNELWKKISIEAEKLSPYSMSTDETPGIFVNQCRIHHGDSHKDEDNVLLKTPEKIIKYRFSYCKEKCEHKLECGHNCQLTCHCHSDPPKDNEHDDYYCQFRCVKKCPNNHQCRGVCGYCTHNQCPNCREIFHHSFPCGHEADIECYLETSGEATCHAKCGKKLDRCDHTCNLQCGHNGSCDCRVKLESICPNCNQAFQYYCGQREECPKTCNHILPCGHQCTNKCIDCIKYGHITECKKTCEFVFACGHHCTHECSAKFPEHHHFFCQQKIELPTKIGQELKKEQECSDSIAYDSFNQRKCYLCNQKWINSNPFSSLKRCRCQCNKKCRLCGKRCRSLEGEKCAFFCRHFPDLKDVKEPAKEKGPIFIFHDDHFLFVDEAIEKVKTIFENMILGKGDAAVPIHRLTCPIEGCSRTEPILLKSLLFESMNCEIERVLHKIKESSLPEIDNKNKDIKGSYQISWYTCVKCSNLFYSILEDPNNAIIKCPHCDFQKGEMFE